MSPTDASPPTGMSAGPTVSAKHVQSEAALSPSPNAQLSGRIALGILLTLGLLAVAWYRPFTEMWLRWFPAWHNYPHLSDRLTKGDSYYSHGPLVPLTSLVLAFFIYKRVGLPARRTRGSTILGWLMFGIGLIFHLLAASPHAAGVTFVSGFALLAVLGGLVLLWGGWPLAKAYWLPVTILIFMVPLPMEMIANLNLRLKSVASDAAVWATNNVFGIIADKDGSYVHLLRADGSGHDTLVVEDVCSGLRSLISLTFFAALFALICRVKGFWRVLMLLMAVPVAIFSNVLRITSLNVVAHHWGVAAASEESWFHGTSGILVFVIALAMLFGLEQAIIALNRLLKRQWVDHRLLGYLSTIKPSPESSADTLRPAPLVVLGLTAVLTLYWTGSVRALPPQGEIAKKAVHSSMMIGDANYTSHDSDLDVQTTTILETNDYLNRQFTAAGRSAAVGLLIVFSQDNRKGTHPPEVCLTGGGEEVVSSRGQMIVASDHAAFPMRELITQHGTWKTYYLYTYKCGGSYTTSFFAQQFRIFANGLLARNARGALIRITVPVTQGEENARNLALAAATELMPQIDRGLETPAP